MNVSASLNGDALRAALRRLMAGAPAALGEGLRAAGEVEAADARRRVPVDSGALRETIRVSAPVVSGAGARVVVGAGGELPYAVTVHEDLSAPHADGEAKFLERAIQATAGNAANALAAGTRRALGGR